MIARTEAERQAGSGSASRLSVTITGRWYSGGDLDQPARRVSCGVASNYGAGIDDPVRFANAAAVYRSAGLAPTMYQSSKRDRPGQHFSREGSAEVRWAIVELGRGLAHHDPDFRDYRRRLLGAHKPPLVAGEQYHRGR
jgi:hypothetical protein